MPVSLTQASMTPWISAVIVEPDMGVVGGGWEQLYFMTNRLLIEAMSCLRALPDLSMMASISSTTSK